jgi:cysteine synthase
MVSMRVISILNTIGNTPLIDIDGIKAKLETYNPSGSIKDRMTVYMIKKAELNGELEKGMEIIEATSGNTGISLAMISAANGYKFTGIMPESMSIERIKMMELFGANVILTSAKDDVAGTIKKYNELIKEKPKAWLPKQFQNKDNIEAHKNGIGKEIIQQTNSKIDAVVAGVGTGGTLLGIAYALKEANINAKIIAVEPFESSVLSGGKQGLHKIQGIGEGFIPELVEKNIHMIDEIIRVKSKDAIEMKDRLAKEKGVLVGISSGANIVAANSLKNRFKNIITILPDRGERYISGQ